MKLLVGSGLVGLLVSLALVGCQKHGDGSTPHAGHKNHQAPQEKDKAGDAEADIQSAWVDLSPDDRRLADAQDFCPIMPDQRLGSMGKPFKAMVKDQPVFLCCKGCQRKALADPDKTLALVEKLKAKTKERKNDSR